MPTPFDSLQILAGPRALARLHENGLDAADIALLPGAAGGPKGLILSGLDRAIFGHWLPAANAKAPRQRWLVGASTGAWRMAAACRRDPLAGVQAYVDLNCSDRDVGTRPTRSQMTAVFRGISEGVVADDADYILNHPHYRLAIVTNRGRSPLAPNGRPRVAGFAAAVLANLWSRRRLAHFLERVVLHDARSPFPFTSPGIDHFATHHVPLSPANLTHALLASATIPFLLDPVPGIAGAPSGLYWDGGLIDYQFAWPYTRLDGLVLYPHFQSRIVPGWLDKTLHHRRAPAGWLDNVIVVAPSLSFIASLPDRKIPDRGDLKRYGSRIAERVTRWRRAIGESDRLGDTFLRFAEAPDLSIVRPLR